MSLALKSLKKSFAVGFLFCLVLTTAQKKMVVVLDAGHGGSDHGTNRTYSSLGYLAEKDITLAIALRVGRMLEKEKDFKVIYTRKTDFLPSLSERTNLANKSGADLFISIHVNANVRTDPHGTETYVQGPNQNKQNLEVAKTENNVIFLDKNDKQMFSQYDPYSPESLIALRIQQSKYLERSLILGGLVEDHFVNKDNRNSRGVKQQNFHVLRQNAMPSILIETGFLSNYEEAQYLASNRGQKEIAESIYNAIINYKKILDKKNSSSQEINHKSIKAENPLKNSFRIFLTSSSRKMPENDPKLQGLKNILIIREGELYKYYYGETQFASVRDNYLKEAKSAGFKDAFIVGFIPNQKLESGYYTIEVYAGKQKLSNSSYILQTLKKLEKTRRNDGFHYTYGNYPSLEEAIKNQEEISKKGIKNTTLQKVSR
ncbi:MAG: N-acetylmuramoyl-L-alanine amidase [Bergeyella sp.]|nr:N-acetylmuramoyl-L-alanine amidase [Bergeyella sp.]